MPAYLTRQNAEYYTMTYGSTHFPNFTTYYPVAVDLSQMFVGKDALRCSRRLSYKMTGLFDTAHEMASINT